MWCMFYFKKRGWTNTINGIVRTALPAPPPAPHPACLPSQWRRAAQSTRPPTRLQTRKPQLRRAPLLLYRRAVPLYRHPPLVCRAVHRSTSPRATQRRHYRRQGCAPLPSWRTVLLGGAAMCSCWAMLNACGSFVVFFFLNKVSLFELRLFSLVWPLSLVVSGSL